MSGQEKPHVPNLGSATGCPPIAGEMVDGKPFFYKAGESRPPECECASCRVKRNAVPYGDGRPCTAAGESRTELCRDCGLPFAGHHFFTQRRWWLQVVSNHAFIAALAQPPQAITAEHGNADIAALAHTIVLELRGNAPPQEYAQLVARVENKIINLASARLSAQERELGKFRTVTDYARCSSGSGPGDLQGYIESLWQERNAQEQTIIESRQSVVLILRELKAAEAAVERLEKALPQQHDLGLAEGRLEQFIRMKKQRPLDPIHWDYHENNTLHEAVKQARRALDPEAKPEEAE